MPHFIFACSKVTCLAVVQVCIFALIFRLSPSGFSITQLLVWHKSFHFVQQGRKKKKSHAYDASCQNSWLSLLLGSPLLVPPCYPKDNFHSGKKKYIDTAEGRVAVNANQLLSPKGMTPNMYRLFCCKTLYCCHLPAFWKAFLELSMKAILLSESLLSEGLFSESFRRAFGGLLERFWGDFGGPAFGENQKTSWFSKLCLHDFRTWVCTKEVLWILTSVQDWTKPP